MEAPKLTFFKPTAPTVNFTSLSSLHFIHFLRRPRRRKRTPTIGKRRARCRRLSWRSRRNPASTTKRYAANVFVFAAAAAAVAAAVAVVVAWPWPGLGCGRGRGRGRSRGRLSFDCSSHSAEGHATEVAASWHYRWLVSSCGVALCRYVDSDGHSRRRAQGSGKRTL